MTIDHSVQYQDGPIVTGTEDFTYNHDTGFLTVGSPSAPTMQVDTRNHVVLLGDPLNGGSVYISPTSFTVLGSYLIDAGGNLIQSVGDPVNPTDAVNLQTVQNLCVIPTNGPGVPTSIPTMIGAEYVDTTSKKVYFATGTSSSSDWTAIN